MFRLLDLGQTSYLHSQTIYHAVAYGTTENSPGTVILISPDRPYFCVGYHQMPDRELNTELCREKGIPVLKREVGGGTVYLDREQLFFQFVIPRSRAPLRVDHLYRLYLAPAVKTYRRLGVKARYQPVNDIQVDDRKICGAGAGQIGEAAVVVGNILFDFDYRQMCQALRLPSEEFRRQIESGMRTYLTTLHRELGFLPDREKVKEILVEEIEKELGLHLTPGELTPDERRRLPELDARFTDPGWLNENVGRVTDWIKITTEVKVTERYLDSRDGPVRIILQLKNNAIDHITLTGPGTSRNGFEFQGLATVLKGQRLAAKVLSKRINDFYGAWAIASPAIGSDDLVTAIMGDHKPSQK